MFFIKNLVNKIWNDTCKMSSSYSISQQQYTHITNETHTAYKEITIPEQESLECYYVNDDTEKTKVNNECKIYENGTKYPLLAHKDALTDSKALKECDKILDIYHKHNNISDKIDPISFDDLDLIIIGDESNVLNAEENYIFLDKHKLRDADILYSNLYNNTNSKADDNRKILVENKTEPEFIDTSNITLHSNSNISKIDPDVNDSEIPATATKTILSNYKIESKFEVNNPTTFLQLTDNVSSNNKILFPNENSQYEGILLENKDSGKNYYKKIPKNNSTVIEILSSDDEDSNNISENIDTSDIISISSGENLKGKSLDQNDSDCSGYHSSDFEFIDEEEAKKFGYYFSNKFETKEQNLDNFIINDYFDTLFPKDEQNNNKGNHLIPEGDNFVNLFNGNCVSSFSYDVESKSVATGVSMNTNFESIGFDLPRYRENPELEAFRQDAYDSARKIRLMYPQGNNSRRRRRY